MSVPYPKVIVLGGPNGSGKSTLAATVARGMSFVNADDIARTLPLEPGQTVDLRASRVLLERLDDLERRRADFAVESTLSNRLLAKRLARLRDSGYFVRIYFTWLPSPDLAVLRVAARVAAGGHDIPEPVIRRRYVAGAVNFDQLYRPVADVWERWDNSGDKPVKIERGTSGGSCPDNTDALVEEAVADALRDHKANGRSVAQWRDGKSVMVPAAEIRIPKRQLPEK